MEVFERAPPAGTPSSEFELGICASVSVDNELVAKVGLLQAVES